MERREQDPGQKSRREAFEHNAVGSIITRYLINEGVMKKPVEKKESQMALFVNEGRVADVFRP